MNSDAHPITAGAEEVPELSEGGARSPASAAPLPRSRSQTALAFLDIVNGARASHLWGMLAWQDIRRRYRRSVLGPLWLTISMGVLVTALGTLYGTLLNANISEYVPFLALGFIFWSMISSLVSESCSAFISAEGVIKETDLPLSIHVYRVVWRNILILCHNGAIFIVVALVFSIWPGATGLLAIPGVALFCLNGIWVGFALGIICARFRDVRPIVASVMRIAFFLTPIIWMPKQLTGKAAFVDVNPFFHFLELVRGPLLGQVPGLVSWLVVSGITVGGWLATLMLLRRCRRRIAYWV